MLDVKELLKQLTDENIVDIMLDMGCSPPTHTSHEGEAIYNSLCHEGGEDKQKLYCYKNENGYRFHCYICLFSGNIIDLIMHIKNWTFEEAFDYLKKKTGIIGRPQDKQFFGEIPILSDDYWKLLQSYKTRKRKIQQMNTFNQNVLGLFTKEYNESWIQDHISIEAMEKFEIGFYLPQNAITIPHRDIEGNLVGVRKRNLDKDIVARGFKYMPMKIQGVEYTHPLMFNLYGLHQNKGVIKKIKKVCIFEAEKSILQLESYYPNSNWGLAICGSSFSQYQKEIVLSLDVDEVIYCKDRDWKDREDPKYFLFKKMYMEVARKFAPFVNFYVIDKGMEHELDIKDSPSDKGKAVFERLLKQKRLITLDMVQEYFNKQ